MFPERGIADDFWLFVRGRAIDKRSLLKARAGSNTLDNIDLRIAGVRLSLAMDTPEEETVPILVDERFYPCAYATLQEAFIAYLIDRVALANFPYPYEMWLRSTTLIMADALRDTTWLSVTACNWDPGSEYLLAEYDPAKNPRTHPQSEELHTMIISDDWSCLSRDTFDFIVREYAGKG